MTHKVLLTIEAMFGLILMAWNPVIGGIASFMMAAYYLSKIKMDVVDKKYGGSWRQYFKSFFIDQ